MAVEPKEIAEELAREHRRRDRSTREVLFSFDDGDNELRMIEISTSVPDGVQ